MSVFKAQSAILGGIMKERYKSFTFPVVLENQRHLNFLAFLLSKNERRNR